MRPVLRFRLALAATASLALIVSPAAAQRSVSGELLAGVALNIPLPLTVTQPGQPPIHLTARYATRPFQFAVYYGLRLGRWDAAGAWELEFVHHKLYLENPTPEIQRFEVSHGFNMLTVNRAEAWTDSSDVLWRAGAGVVLAHAEGTVRGQVLSTSAGRISGYHFGPAGRAGVGWRSGSQRLLATAELGATVGYVRARMSGGTAKVVNLAIHARIGVGYGVPY